MDELTDDETAMLHIESRRWRHVGAKETAIRDRFDIGPTTYYARLNRLLDTQAAEAAEPALVHRLRRLRAQRAAARSGARAG